MRRIKIRVIPNAKKNRMVEEPGRWKVYLTAPPAGGRANKKLIVFLAESLSVKSSKLRIVLGQKSRDKLVEIAD